MREIKFRAWDEVSKQMGAVKRMAFDPKDIGIIIVDKVTHRPYEVSRAFAPVMQFTGLKDKKGKEIYEGDIVRFMYNATPQEEHIGPVEWNTEYLAWWFDRLLIEPTPQETIEVIGNIYENPELIKT